MGMLAASVFLGSLPDLLSTKGPQLRLHSDLRKQIATSEYLIYIVSSFVSQASWLPIFLVYYFFKLLCFSQAFSWLGLWFPDFDLNTTYTLWALTSFILLEYRWVCLKEEILPHPFKQKVVSVSEFYE